MSAEISVLPQRGDERSAVYLQSFAVRYEYPVCFTEHLFAHDNPVFHETLIRRDPSRRHRFVVFIDSNVAASFPSLANDIAGYADLHAEGMELVARPEVVPGGEHVKNDPALLTRLQQRLVELRVDRHNFVVGIGGGAFLDLIGYVASSTHRGIRHVRVPTTVLAQNDSGVGVKNGVNAFGVKNLLGSFAPPFAVLNDFDFLRTLQPRDKIAGIAEAVKVALIRDRIFFEWLEAKADALRACEGAAMSRMAMIPSSPDAVGLHVAPLFHVAAAGRMIAHTLIGGGAVILPSFRPEELLDCVERHAIVEVVLIPSMLQMLLAHPTFSPQRLASLRRVF